jgi:hypothetical protein
MGTRGRAEVGFRGSIVTTAEHPGFRGLLILAYRNGDSTNPSVKIPGANLPKSRRRYRTPAAIYPFSLHVRGTAKRPPIATIRLLLWHPSAATVAG